jgi:CubicO group peptidase (beta-lactamase class C family)
MTVFYNSQNTASVKLTVSARREHTGAARPCRVAVPRRRERREERVSLQENIRRIASAPLVHRPGVVWQYSVAIDVLGAVMGRAAGRSLPEIVAERITHPLEMRDTSFTVADVNRLAVPYADATPQPKRMSDGEVVPYMTGAGITFAPSRAFDPTSFPSGGGGMIGSAPDLLRFFETIRRGGRPVLSEESTAQMMRNQNANLSRDAQGPTPGWGFGFGGSVVTDPAPRARLSPAAPASGAACTGTPGSSIPSANSH